MHNHSDSDSQTLDTYLADYADDLINGVASVHNEFQSSNEDLERVVRQVHAEFQLVSPDAATRERIRTNLTQQWHQMHGVEQGGVFQRWWRSVSADSWGLGRHGQRLSVFVLAGIAVVVLVFLIALNVGSTQPLPASAGGDLLFGIVAVGLGVIVAGAALFFSRRK